MGVREVDRSDHQEPRELTAPSWVEEAFFAGATLPQLCLPVGMQQLFAPSSTGGLLVKILRL